ncbi:MAG: hypothetical protein IT428_17130 [Planctomycetaceae bacterium]|nr:hypothetical protein [Planctomycetaceae bacterium]
MAFRQSLSRREQWSAYCQKHAELIDGLPDLLTVLQTDDRFDEFLQTGEDPIGKPLITLSDLPDCEWDFLVRFVERYALDWQSWFSPTAYPAWFAERLRRNRK